MIRGFTSNREEKNPVSFRISASSKNIIDLATEATNYIFEEDNVNSKISMTDIIEEIVANSIFNEHKLLQIDDRFYSLKEIFFAYFENKFNKNNLNDIISKEQLINCILDLRCNIAEIIQNYFVRKRMIKYIIDDEENIHEIYNFCIKSIADIYRHDVERKFKVKIVNEILNVLMVLDDFRGMDIFLKLNTKEIIWFKDLVNIIDNFVENVIMNNKTTKFEKYVDEIYNR